jgi:hypothetical protein
MKMAVLFPTAFVAIISCVRGAEEQTEKNPIMKVVGMMQDMVKELEHEAEVEKDLFKKAGCACETGEKELTKVIEHETVNGPQLQSKIEAETAEETKLSEEIAAHKDDKAKTEKSLSEATSMREKEATEFAEAEKMQVFTLDSMTQAITTLEGKSAAAFIQMKGGAASRDFRRIVSVSRYLDDSKRNVVLGFLDEAEGIGSGEPSAGTAQIVGILKAMKDEATKDLADIRKEEADAVAGYGEMKEAKTTALGVVTKSIMDKEKRVGELKLSLVNNKDALEDSQQELEQSQKYLATMQEQCAAMFKTKEMREKMRADEIAAIGEAIKILTDDDALDTFSTASATKPTLIQQGSKQPQQAPEQREEDDGESNYGAFVQTGMRILSAAKKHTEPDHSGAKDASSTAQKVVDYMVNEMVEVLHDDDVNDEHKKIFCENETETFTQINTEKTSLKDELEKSIEVMTTDLEQLKADIKQLEFDINANDQEVLELTKIRKEEHEEFVKAYQANDVAVQLIDKAANRLNKFYNPSMGKKKALFLKISHEAPSRLKAFLSLPEHPSAARHQEDDGEANEGAFIQIKSSVNVAPPEIPDVPTTYEKKESGGVMGLMNEIKTELKMDMKESEMEEKFAAKDYGRMMKEAKASRETDVKTLTGKKSVKAETEDKLIESKEKLKLTEKELYQLKMYLKKLDVECSFLVRNFDNRHEARVDEEVGLKSAESIVTKEDVPSHNEAEQVFEDEHSKKDVDEHFDAEMPVGH